MSTLKVPGAWLSAKVSARTIEAASIAETSRIDAKISMSEEIAGKGLCPECKLPMIEAVAGNSLSWVCVADRISLPKPNAV
jgi:hypothetical protein